MSVRPSQDFALCPIIDLFFEVGITTLPMYSELDNKIVVTTNSEHGVDTVGHGDSAYGKSMSNCMAFEPKLWVELNVERP